MMKGLFIALAVVMFAITGIGGCSKMMEFRGGCEDYLKLAGDAPSTEKAVFYLDKALSYIENHNLTSGNVAYFFHNPSSDLGIWYANIKGARDAAVEMIAQKQKDPSSIKPVDESNQLVKIREVVIDAGEQGATKVTSPGNAWVAPFQWLLVLGWALFFIFAICAVAAYVADPY